MLRIETLILSVLASVFAVFGGENLTLVPTAVRTLEYNLRLEAGRRQPLTVTMVWNYRSDDNYRGIEYTIPPVTDDNLTGAQVRYRIIGGDEAAFNIRYDRTPDDGFSAILKVNPDGASVVMGTQSAAETVPVDFDSADPGMIGYILAGDTREIRNDIRYSARTAPEFAPFPDTDSLKAYIAASEDPREALWIHLDRETDLSMSRIGGRYMLATIADGTDGDYSIIYLGGAEYGRWQPLQIKGRLRPTIFRDHFNLEWLDASGQMIDRETSAFLELEGTILHINFPLYGATLRYSKVIENR